MRNLLALLTAAVALSASAAEPPFKYDTNKFSAYWEDGAWRLRKRPAPAPKLTVAAPVAEPAYSSWLDRISIAPVGAIRTVDINGASEWGFGVDAGYAVNPFVSLHVVNLAFEGPGHSRSHDNKPDGKNNDGFTTGPHSWGGSAIDETDLLVKAVISPFSTERLSVYALAGGVHTWEDNQRWGLSAGGGVAYNFSKTFSVGGDYSVRMFDSPDSSGSSLDSLVRALVSIKF